jgi:hypothetical protein
VIESDEPVDRILEDVFGEWNHGSGMESVNDRYFQCVSIGWNEVDIAYVNDLENEVSTNKYRDTSAWMALSDVMWQRIKNIKQNLVAV